MEECKYKIGAIVKLDPKFGVKSVFVITDILVVNEYLLTVLKVSLKALTEPKHDFYSSMIDIIPASKAEEILYGPKI